MRRAFGELRHIAAAQLWRRPFVAIGAFITQVREWMTRAACQLLRSVTKPMRGHRRALRHHREAIERARRARSAIASDTCASWGVEQERLGLAETRRARVDEADEHAEYRLIEPEASSSTTAAAACPCGAASMFDRHAAR